MTYSQQFDRENGLDYGRLVLRSIEEDSTGRTHRVWVATSSHATKQGAEDFHQRGGLIPPEYRCGIPSWSVELVPIPMPNNPGVRGNFYKINPHLVTTDKGGQRGDFGIHDDPNYNTAPGSQGCIVLRGERWKDFEDTITKLRDTEKLQRIPLFVTYS